MFCLYCGRRCEFFCSLCKENHLGTAEEFKEQNGDWPEDYEGDDE